MDEPWPKPRRLEVRLARAVDIAPAVRMLTLEADAPFEWVAGQHVKLLVESGGRTLEQPFSIASAPDRDAPGRLELAVAEEATSEATTAVWRLVPGARVRLEGPKGRLTRRGRETEPALLVATGTGVAPLRAMVQEELGRTGDGPPLVLLYGARTERDALWASELRALSDQHPRFRFEPTLSQPAAGWTGRTGYVQDHVVELARELTAVGPAPVFLCGQPEMVDDARALLEGAGHPAELVLAERY